MSSSWEGHLAVACSRAGFVDTTKINRQDD